MTKTENNKIKVLLFELNYKTGGIESFLINLYNEIDRDRIEFHVVSSYDNPENADIFEHLGGRVYKIAQPKHFFEYLRSMNKLMKNGGFDIAHMNKCSAVNIFPVLMAWLNHIPVVLHSHNSMSRMGKISIPIQYINRMIIGKISIVHLACSEVAGKWMYGMRGQYRIIRNGIIVDRYLYSNAKDKDKRKELGIPEKALVYTNLGDLRKQKNPLFLIEIFAELVKLQDCYLIIIGDGVMRKEVEESVQNKGISDRVIFLGKRNDVPDLLSCVNGLIMPSLFEGLPMACVEAQACGCKLFLSDCISKEVELTDNVCWFSLKESANKIANIINDNSGCVTKDERYKSNNIISNIGFDIKKSADDVAQIYEDVFNNRYSQH